MIIRTQTFQNKILSWYKKNGRHHLPWRKTVDPYHVLVSEIMLQQTQVDRVIGKYEEFVQKFPTIQMLAEASQQDVLRVWSGLGYNRRALFLQKAAQYIMRKYTGIFPQKIGDIEKLPGVGPYTARAVRVFAYNMPEVFIETNIRRIYIHFFFSHVSSRAHSTEPVLSLSNVLRVNSVEVRVIPTVVEGSMFSHHPRRFLGIKPRNDTLISDRELLPIVEKTLWKKNPREWYSALMDYGSSEFKNIPNPNKKSRRYARQSKFEGSRRQARAYILKNILTQGDVSDKDVQGWLKAKPLIAQYAPTSIVRRILQEMEKEGFLVRDTDKWKIKMSL